MANDDLPEPKKPDTQMLTVSLGLRIVSWNLSSTSVSSSSMCSVGMYSSTSVRIVDSIVDLDDLFDLAIDRAAEQFFDSHDSPRGMMRAR